MYSIEELELGGGRPPKQTVFDVVSGRSEPFHEETLMAAAKVSAAIPTIDADGSSDAAEIPWYVAALLAGADFAAGIRFLAGGASDDITVTRRWGDCALSAMVNRLGSVKYSDFCYGCDAFWGRSLPQSGDCNGFRGRDAYEHPHRSGESDHS